MRRTRSAFAGFKIAQSEQLPPVVSSSMATQAFVQERMDNCATQFSPSAPILVTDTFEVISAANNAPLSLKRPRTLRRRRGPFESHHRQYQRRKLAGLCTATGCPRKSAVGHTHCHEHLRLMSRRQKQRYAARVRQEICISCGERPRFWGVRCVICRQKFSQGPLPLAARKALRKYREAEALLEMERMQADARFLARKLLASGEIQGLGAEALRLYTGIDGGRWRTYEEVARIMHVSKQRIGHLLSPLRGVLKHVDRDDVQPR